MQSSDFENYFIGYPILKKHFRGTFSIDTLPKSLKNLDFCVCNTDFSTGAGIHWFFILKTSKNTIEVFDSLGIDSQKEKNIETYFKFRGIRSIQFNESVFQNQESTTCGLFVIYFIWQRMFNLDLSFDEILEHIFDHETSLNELKVTKFCEKLKNQQI